VRVQPQGPDKVASAIIPDYSLSSHVAALGLAFQQGGSFPAQYQGGAFVGEHGSWDRTRYNGYEVAFVPMAAGKPTGKASTFLGNFITADEKTRCRPVGVAFDRTGALQVADDVGNVVWRVAPVRQPG
jgi:glucose/arabinose dehydrogenase